MGHHCGISSSSSLRRRVESFQFHCAMRSSFPASLQPFSFATMISCSYRRKTWRFRCTHHSKKWGWNEKKKRREEKKHTQKKNEMSVKCLCCCLRRRFYKFCHCGGRSILGTRPVSLSFSVVWCHSTWLSRISGLFLCSRSSFPVRSRPVVNPIALIHLFVGSGSE